MATPLTEPFLLAPAPDSGIVKNTEGKLQKLLEKKLGEFESSSRPKSARAFKTMGIALVDLTRASVTGDKASHIDYAGINDDRQHRAFSLAKIAIMFAAFRLRERVKLAARGVLGDPFEELTKGWKGKIATKVPELRRDFPEWRNIFELTGAPGAWTFEFTSSGEDWGKLNQAHGAHGASNATLNAMGFLERMALMVAHSDNGAAGSCLRQLGYQYVNGTLVAEGFQLPGRNKTGLWVGSDYVGIRSAGYHPPKPPAPIPDLTQGATALAVAKLLTLLHTNRLVDGPSSNTMRNLMHFGVGTRSFWKEGLRAAEAPRPVAKIIRKIGMGAMQSEGGIVIRSSPDIKYAAVGLGTPTVEPLQDLAVVLDDCILENNGHPIPT